MSVRPPVCPSVCLSVCLYSTLFHFILWTAFYMTFNIHVNVLEYLKISVTCFERTLVTCSFIHSVFYKIFFVKYSIITDNHTLEIFKHFFLKCLLFRLTEEFWLKTRNIKEIRSGGPMFLPKNGLFLLFII